MRRFSCNIIPFFLTLEKMPQILSSAATVIGALRAKLRNYFELLFQNTDIQRKYFHRHDKKCIKGLRTGNT